MAKYKAGDTIKLTKSFSPKEWETTTLDILVPINSETKWVEKTMDEIGIKIGDIMKVVDVRKVVNDRYTIIPTTGIYANKKIDFFATAQKGLDYITEISKLPSKFPIGWILGGIAVISGLYLLFGKKRK